MDTELSQWRDFPVRPLVRAPQPPGSEDSVVFHRLLYFAYGAPPSSDEAAWAVRALLRADSALHAALDFAALYPEWQAWVPASALGARVGKQQCEITLRKSTVVRISKTRFFARGRRGVLSGRAPIIVLVKDELRAGVASVQRAVGGV